MDSDLLKEYLLTAFPNPDRNGCPDEDTLKALAERQLPLNDPAMVHVGSCSECYAEYLNYRQDWKEKSSDVPNNKSLPLSGPPVLTPSSLGTAFTRPNRVAWGIAAALVVVVGGGFLLKEHRTPAPAGALVASTSGSHIAASMDLFNAVTARGGGDDAPTPLEQVSLPSSVIHLTVTLPRFSESGPYEVFVSKDRAGSNVVAHGSGNAVEASGRVGLVVTLDLTKAAPGMYYLATMRGADNGTYYYPLRVQ